MKKILVITSAILLLAAACNKQAAVQPAPAPAPVSENPALTAITDPTASWKTYTYPEFGYSFKIPSTYFLNVNAVHIPTAPYILQSLSTSAGSNINGGGANDLGFFVLSASSLQDGIKEIISGAGPISNQKEVAVNNEKWTSFNMGSPNVETVYTIYMNSRLYYFGGDSKNSELIKTIASTFEFTK